MFCLCWIWQNALPFLPVGGNQGSHYSNFAEPAKRYTVKGTMGTLLGELLKRYVQELPEGVAFFIHQSELGHYKMSRHELMDWLKDQNCDVKYLIRTERMMVRKLEKDFRRATSVPNALGRACFNRQ
jgi:hypothetical protein